MQVRQAGTETMVSTKTSGRAKPDWGYQAKKVGGTALMFVPPSCCSFALAPGGVPKWPENLLLISIIKVRTRRWNCHVLALRRDACHGLFRAVDKSNIGNGQWRKVHLARGNEMGDRRGKNTREVPQLE